MSTAAPTRPAHRIRPTRRRYGAIMLTALVVLAGLVLASGPAQARGGSGYHSYVALGDSYTAAPGVPTTRWFNGCWRSDGNYPSLLAAKLGLGTVRDASCTGATTADLTSSKSTGIAPQLDAITKRTDLVTLSIGGNDEALFYTLLVRCSWWTSYDPHGSPCRDVAQSGGDDLLADVAARTAKRLLDAVAQIRARAPEARIVVIGYPKLFPDTTTCPDLVPLADGDYAYVNHILSLVNDGMRAAADSVGGDYVDVWTASEGHDICSADPWMAGQYAVPDKAQAWHPFPVEQAAVADLVAAELAG